MFQVAVLLLTGMVSAALPLGSLVVASPASARRYTPFDDVTTCMLPLFYL
jgi:hypothetical protein